MLNYKIQLNLNEDNMFEKYRGKFLSQNDTINDVPISDIESILTEFSTNPYNLKNVNALIEMTRYKPFPIPPSFLVFIVDLLRNNINTNEMICLLGLILHFPIDYFINSFPIVKIAKTVINFIDTSSEAITIFTFFLQNIIHFPGLDNIFLKLGVIEKVGEQLNNSDPMIVIQSIIFFRYLLKMNLPFLYDNLCIYDKILKIAIYSLNIFSIHTIYHFAKNYIKFKTIEAQKNKIKNNDNNEDIIPPPPHHHHHHKKKKNYPLAENLIFPELFIFVSQVQIHSETYLLYLMKFYYLVSKIKKIYHYQSDKIINVLPLVFSCIMKPDSKITDYSLQFIYNILRDGKDKAYNDINELNPELIHFLFQNYENYGFSAQKEILFIFIEYSYFLNADELCHFFEEFNIIQIFSEIGLSEDRDILEDFFLCFLNIYDTFVKSNPDYLKYFKDEDFVNMIESLNQKYSSYYLEFYQNLKKILST